MEATHGPIRRGGLVGPIILVMLGVLFLLHNVGLINWNVWELMVWLWPVILIAIGLDILIGRRSMIGSMVVLLLTALAVLLGTQLIARTAGPVTGSETITQPLGSATHARIMLGMDVGDLSVGPLRESSSAIEATVERRRNEVLERTQNADGDTIIFGLNVRSSGPVVMPWGRNDSKSWGVRINPALTSELSVMTGAGAVTLNLAELNVTHLDLSTGAGDLVVALPSTGRLMARISSGAGKITIHVPEGMAVRAHGSSGLGDVDVPATYTRTDDTYTSPNYTTAEHRAEIEISTGVGAIVINDQ